MTFKKKKEKNSRALSGLDTGFRTLQDGSRLVCLGCGSSRGHLRIILEWAPYPNITVHCIGFVAISALHVRALAGGLSMLKFDVDSRVVQVALVCIWYSSYQVVDFQRFVYS
jgi:hypothetical protein